MVGGQLDNLRVGFIIQARMQSARLPNKVLMPIPYKFGKPLLQWITDELKKSSFDSEIIVATSNQSENDVLEEFCNKNSLNCYRGEEENVLSRFVHLAELKRFNVIVRLTGDNPILDIGILDDVIRFHANNNNDYTYSKGLPLGMNYEIICPVVLAQLENKELSAAEKEHVTLAIRNNEKYKKDVYVYEEDEVPLENLRLTLDYASDFLLLSTILSQITPTGSTGVDLIKNTWIENPWLFSANEENVQKKQFQTQKEEMIFAVGLLDRYELKWASKMLKGLN